MGLIKEYVDRAVQTETDTVPSPYADPAVVLAAPHAHNGHRHSISASSPTASDSAYAVPQSQMSPVLAQLVARRPSKRKHARYPGGEIVNRRIVSMPENTSEASSVLSHSHGKRVVSMPDRVRPVLEPSAELFPSPSTAAGDSFGSYTERRERVRIIRAPSDLPQTPSPPSSPESLLIIAAGTQLPEGFLRRKYSPEPLIEEEEDWITWTNSPPRPIPALHGPLSLPYARCPSGAEGTIIEEPDNVAQMIWGLGPDDQPHNHIRAEGLSSYHNPQNASSHGPSHVPPRMQKKRTPAIQQVPKLSRTQISTQTNHMKQGLGWTQRQTHDDKRTSLSHVSPDIDAHQDITSELPWNDGQSMPTSCGISDDFLNDADVFPIDNSRVLEWQIARLRQALRTSLADMDSCSACPGRLEPVIPAVVTPGLPQSYPRIFVEPRPNESISSATRQLPVEIAQQYRQQQMYKQALQTQKLQVQNMLPTPPNSSSPQWSSHFSPYLTYCSAFSPELVGSTEHPVPASSQKYRPGTNASQYLRRVYDCHEHDYVSNLDTNTNIPSTQIPQIVNSTVSLRQSSSSSSTLAKYIKQLQALSPNAHFSPLRPVPPPNVPLPQLPSADESAVGHFQSVYHPTVTPTPPSPESPKTRGSAHHARTMPPTRSMQRRLSSVPEEDSTLLEISTSVSPPRLQGQVKTDGTSSRHDGTMGHHMSHLEKTFVDVTRKPAVADLPEFESNLGQSIAFHHESSPVKVRLPVTKEHNTREQSDGYNEQNKEGPQHGHRKKHRYKKPKGPATTNEQAQTRGLVG